MPSLNKEENKRNISDLELLLLIEMGFFSNLKKAKLKFNLRPVSEPKHLQVEPIDWSFDTGFLNRLKQMKIRFNPRSTSEPSSNDTVKTTDENVVDLHLEIVKKIDELLEGREKETQLREFEPVTQIQQQLPLQEFVEFREVSVKKPEVSQFNAEVQPGNVFREVNQEEELFEIVPPVETQSIDKNQQVNDDFNSTMIREVQRSHKLFMGATHVKIKIRSSPKKAIEAGKPQEELNGFAKKQIELEKTRQEIEEREIALKEAKEKEKTKEEELKKAREEELEQEKLKKLEQKKREQKKKLEERELKKAEKLRQIELKKLEKEILLKLKEKEKEDEKAERLKQIELKKLEEEKLLKFKEKEKEVEKVEGLKQIELKKQEKARLLEVEQKEKEELEKLKQKQRDEEEAKKQKERELIEQEKVNLKEEKKKEKLKHKEVEKIKAKKPKKEKTSLFGWKKPKKKKTEEKPIEQPVEEIEEKPLEIDEMIKERAPADQKLVLDNDVEQLLPILDELLENLPEDVIDEFAHSDKFTLYEKIMKKYQNK